MSKFLLYDAMNNPNEQNEDFEVEHLQDVEDFGVIVPEESDIVDELERTDAFGSRNFGELNELE